MPPCCARPVSSVSTLAIVTALAATTATGAAADGGDNVGLAWTFGAHASIPLGPAVSAAAILGHANAYGADGLVLYAEPGLLGGKIGVGYADVDGSAKGPYLVSQWHDWSTSRSWLWVSRGWSARGVIEHQWGSTFGIPSGRTFGGGELELIGTFGSGEPWGGVHGVNLTAGLLTNLDRVDHGPVRHPGDQWRLEFEAGVGF
jgi:hypothetical protein